MIEIHIKYQYKLYKIKIIIIKHHKYFYLIFIYNLLK